MSDDFTRYVILLRRNPGADITPELMRRHVEHLKRLEERGQLVLCGPFSDRTGGMTIIRAVSLEAAQAVAQADPLVSSGMETYEVRTLLLSCRENNHRGIDV